MRKFSKVLMGVALFLILSGGMLSLVGWAMGANTVLSLDKNGYHIELSSHGFSGLYYDGDGETRGERTANAQNLYTDNLESFQTLDLDVDMGSLDIQESDSLALELDAWGEGYELHYSNENGVLKIWSTDTVRHRANSNVGGAVILYLPEGTKLKQADLNLGMGDVCLQDFSADTLTLTADLGDVTLIRVWTGELTVDASLGGVTLEETDARVMDLDLDMGDLSLTECGISDELTVSNSMGSVEIYGGELCDTDISADMGSVTVETRQPKSSYTYQLDADMGSVHVDGEKQPHDGASGGTGQYALDISTSMGSIDVYFGG